VVAAAARRRARHLRRRATATTSSTAPSRSATSPTSTSRWPASRTPSCGPATAARRTSSRIADDVRDRRGRVALFAASCPTSSATRSCASGGTGRRRARAPRRGGAADAGPHLPGRRPLPPGSSRSSPTSTCTCGTSSGWSPPRSSTPTYERPDPLPVAVGRRGLDRLLRRAAADPRRVWKPRRLLDTLRDTWARPDTPGALLQPPAAGVPRGLDQALRPRREHPQRHDRLLRPRSLVAWELDLRLRAADPDGDGLDAVFRRAGVSWTAGCSAAWSSHRSPTGSGSGSTSTRCDLRSTSAHD
jgi:hypothetical protein